MSGPLLALALALPAAPELDDARDHFAAGRYEKAHDVLLAMLRDGHGDERAVRLLLAEAQLMVGEPRAALDTLEPLARGGPEVDYLLGIGFLDYGLQMERAGGHPSDIGWAFGEARTYLERAAEADPPDDPKATLELGYFLVYQLGDPLAAREVADRALARRERGDLLLLRGVASVNAYAAAAAAGAEDADALRDEAELDLLLADAELDTDAEPWVQLAWLYETAGNPKEAVDAALKASELAEEPDSGLLYRLARRYGASDPEAATRALLALVERDPAGLVERLRAEPDVTAAANDLAAAGSWLYRRRRYADLRDVLGVILQAGPDDAALYNNHAFMCRETGRYEDAYASYRDAIEIDGRDPRLLNDAALILHYHLGRDLDVARELYERAIALADERLAAEDLDRDAASELRVARRDARTNLERLGVGTPPGG